ncbi:MAG: ATP-binding protein, partial [Bdellovibrionales bacterium]
MTFFGRGRELKILNDFNQNRNSFIGVIYGRRRVGKSRFIAEFTKDKPSFIFEGLQGESTQNQINHFCEQLARQTNDHLLLKANLPNWNRTFDVLTDYLSKKNKHRKTILVLDEIQWMAGHRSQLISLIKYYWDNHWRQFNVDIILCGSIASFMVKKVIKSKALYGRIDVELKLEQLRPDEAAQFLIKKRSPEEILLYQMIFGRVPKYFENIDPKRSFEVNLNRLCFQSNGIMVNEIDKIFYSQFKKTSIYFKIVRALLNGPKTLQELSLSLLVSSGGGLKEYLTNLELAQYIGSDSSLDKKINSKYKKYFLADEYLIFHKKYIEPNLSHILKNTNRSIFTQLVKPSWSPWLGLAFERFCLNNAEYLAEKLGFKESLIGFGPLIQKNPGLQIDLIFKRSDKVIVICEMKYSKNIIYKEVISEVQTKIDKLRAFKGFAIEKALVAPFGDRKKLEQQKYFD